MFTWLNNTKITFQILGLTILILIIFLAAMGILVQLNMKNMSEALMDNTQSQLVEIGKQTAETLDATLDSNVFNHPEEMQAVIDQNMKIRQNNNAANLILEIRVHAPDPTSSVGYRAIAANSPDLVGQESDPEDIQAIKNDKIVVDSITEDGIPVLDVTVPLHKDGKAIATAGIKLSMAQFYAEQAQLQDKTNLILIETMLIVILISGTLSIFLALFLSRRITHPLQMVITHFQQIAENGLGALSNELAFLSQGDLTRQLTISFKDVNVNANREANQLGLSFNTMIAQLRVTGDAFNKMVSNFKNLVGQLSEDAILVQSASEQLATSSNQTENGANQISIAIQTISQGITQEAELVSNPAKSVEQLSSGVEEISASTEEMNAQVQEVNVSAHSMAKTAQVLKNIVGQFKLSENL